MVLPELSRTTAYRTRNTVNRLARNQVKFESCGTKKIKGGINLYIELQEHKLDQIAARNIRISLDKPIALQSYGVSEGKRRRTNMTTVMRINLLYSQTALIIARPGVTLQNASKQHIHSKCHVLSLKSTDLGTYNQILQ